MANSKQAYGEELIKTVNGGNYTSDSKITLRQAMRYIGQARDALVRKYLWQTDYEMEDYLYAGFVVPYIVTTQKDTVRDKYYAKLPANPIWIPNNEGIVQVSFPHDEVNGFIPMPTASMQIYGALDASFLEGNLGYYPEKDRIYLYGLEKDDCELLIKLIPDSNSIGDLDYFPISPDLVDEMFQVALQRAGLHAQQPQDNVNDNADIR